MVPRAMGGSFKVDNSYGKLVKPSSSVRKEKSQVQTQIEIIWTTFEVLYMMEASLPIRKDTGASIVTVGVYPKETLSNITTFIF